MHQAFASAASAAEAVCKGAAVSQAAQRAGQAVANAALQGKVEVVTRPPPVTEGCVAAIAAANITATTVAEAARSAVKDASCTCPKVNYRALSTLESNTAFTELEQTAVDCVGPNGKPAQVEARVTLNAVADAVAEAFQTAFQELHKCV
ncbi:hypothetical protein N2152v2_011166 [Parachlorella kessleri]